MSIYIKIDVILNSEKNETRKNVWEIFCRIFWHSFM